MAYELLQNLHYRSAASRSYFTVYAMVSEYLKDVISFRPNWEGPTHSRLQSLVLNNLYRLEKTVRHDLQEKISALYTLRLQADYCPSVKFGEEEARSSIGLMKRVLETLEVYYAESNRSD